MARSGNNELLSELKDKCQQANWPDDIKKQVIALFRLVVKEVEENQIKSQEATKKKLLSVYVEKWKLIAIRKLQKEKAIDVSQLVDNFLTEYFGNDLNSFRPEIEKESEEDIDEVEKSSRSKPVRKPSKKRKTVPV